MGLIKDTKSNILTTTVEAAVNWGRKNSLWPMPFGTACCGIELMAVLASRSDIARFGAEAIRFSPRQSDLLLVAGRITIKMMPVLQRIYEQMPEPKWVISMGACASSGGVFDTYSVIQGVERSEEHTSELQSQAYLVCRLLLEKKKKKQKLSKRRV